MRLYYAPPIPSFGELYDTKKEPINVKLKKLYHLRVLLSPRGAYGTRTRDPMRDRHVF